MTTTTTTDSQPSLCAKGCGFYGSPQTNNLCSKCYNEEYQKKLREEPLLPQPSSAEGTEDDVVCALAAVKLDNKGRKPSRCKACNKKVGLLGFACRCGDVFCGSHRYGEEHGCNVDVKGMGRRVLEKENPVIKADKLEYRI